MRTQQKTVFAVLAVLMMAAVPFAVMADTESVDAISAASKIPSGSDYAYVIDFDVDNVKIVDVYVVSGNSLTTTTDLTSVTGTGTLTRTLNTNTTTWKFNDDGCGPFNCFYAAINLKDHDPTTESPASTAAEYNEERLSQRSGQIAYVLDPDNLNQTLAGNQFIVDDYNVMLIIPTVYWYSTEHTLVAGESSIGKTVGSKTYAAGDKVSRLYLSNKSAGFSSTSFTGKDSDLNMVAYAHTFDNTVSGDWSSGLGTVYPYIGISVYEGSTKTIDGNNVLVSQSGKTPAVSINRGTARDYALNNNTISDNGVGRGSYGLWNFYQWTLYKMMSYTILGNTDAQWAVGSGVTKTAKINTGGSAMAYMVIASESNTATSQTATSLLIENSWGNVWEFVDDIWWNNTENGALHIGNSSSVGFDSTNHYVLTGQYTDTSATAQAAYQKGISQKLITKTSNLPQYWGMVTAVGSSAASVSDGSTMNDSIWGKNGQNFIVGGCCAYGLACGLAAASANDSLVDAFGDVGARLAYFISTDAASVDYDLNGIDIKSEAPVGAAGKITGLTTKTPVAPTPVLSTATFCGWNTRADGNGVDYTANTNITLYGDTTLYAKWTISGSGENKILFVSGSDVSSVDWTNGTSKQLPNASGTDQFIGWYTSGSGGTFIGTFGQYYTNPSATAKIYYAQYAKTSYSVSHTVTDSSTAYTSDGDISVLYTDTLKPGSIGMLSIVKNKAGMTVTPTISNGSLTKINDTTWKISGMTSDATINVTVTDNANARGTIVSVERIDNSGENATAKVTAVAGEGQTLSGKLTVSGVAYAIEGGVTVYSLFSQEYSITGTPESVTNTFTVTGKDIYSMKATCNGTTSMTVLE